ncbi:MAG: FAD-dependent oxidoreductase, partial [Candidatus Berkiella sp.]
PMIHRISLRDGNASLPMRLAVELNHRLHLNKVLTAVNIDNNTQYVLTFADGETVTCNKLILAIPCTVFKNIQIDPRVIGKHRLMQIQGIPYGTTAKVLLPIKQQSPSGHWVSTAKMGAFFNDDKQLLNLYYIQDNGQLLQDNALYAQSLQTVKAGFSNAILNTLPVTPAKDINYSEYSVPVSKSWISDPFALGSYSAFDTHQGQEIDKRIDYHGTIMKALFAPINDRLFFVGEHATIIDEIGTMEAAVESGERIAKLLINQP